MPSANQILSVAQMRTAEDALIRSGSSVEALMDAAGRGAAEWVWRVAGGNRLTVLCGPGNNGGDGYVIAEAIRERGGDVIVVEGYQPRSPAARIARQSFQGKVVVRHEDAEGEVFVDCLFGNGLTRPLAPEDAALLLKLAHAHRIRIAVDVPSGVQSDTGMLLNAGLPTFDLTLALGAWKYAHFLMPACAEMGQLRLVDIGVQAVASAGQALGRPELTPPAPDSHKYKRGLLAIVAGTMPGAAVLAGRAAQGAGAGYVKLLSDHGAAVPNDLVLSDTSLEEVLGDSRITAALVGPGLGRDANAHRRLTLTLACSAPLVLDADALMLLSARSLANRKAPSIATPHEGELMALERAFGCAGSGSKPERVLRVAKAGNMIIVAKGSDTVIAAPDGRVTCAPSASSWLSTAGTGDVLAGTIASRLATRQEAFAAACEGVWLHTEAARLCGPAFTAGDLAGMIPQALARCL